MKKKKIWGITLAAIMVTSVIGSSTAVFAGEKTGGDIPPAQMAEVSQDKLLSEIDALADEYNRIYDSHIDLWDKLYDAYNSLEADYDFEDFDENTFIRSLKTMTEAEKDLPEDYDFEDYDEIEAIKGVKSLTEAEKAALIADIKKLDEIEKKLDELYKSVWGEDYGDDTIAFDDDNV